MFSLAKLFPIIIMLFYFFLMTNNKFIEDLKNSNETVNSQHQHQLHNDDNFYIFKFR
jgi:hypothetical protein